MTQDEKVELVARAMLADELKATNSRRDFDEEWEREKLVWTQNARAAIAAIAALPVEEPTTGDAGREASATLSFISAAVAEYKEAPFRSADWLATQVIDALAGHLPAQSQPTADVTQEVERENRSLRDALAQAQAELAAQFQPTPDKDEAITEAMIEAGAKAFGDTCVGRNGSKDIVRAIYRAMRSVQQSSQ